MPSSSRFLFSWAANTPKVSVPCVGGGRVNVPFLVGRPPFSAFFLLAFFLLLPGILRTQNGTASEKASSPAPTRLRMGQAPYSASKLDFFLRPAVAWASHSESWAQNKSTQLPAPNPQRPDHFGRGLLRALIRGHSEGPQPTSQPVGSPPWEAAPELIESMRPAGRSGSGLYLQNHCVRAHEQRLDSCASVRSDKT